jgi:hypothetical protein
MINEDAVTPADPGGRPSDLEGDACRALALGPLTTAAFIVLWYGGAGR